MGQVDSEHCLSTASSGPRKLALLVGVGRYFQRGAHPGQKPWPVLHTETEIELYRKVLITDYAFHDRDVLVLLDENATKAAIRREFFQHLVAQARPGDVLLFHFSGHGQQLPDDPDPARRDEPDGLDESLVPYDALDQSISEGAAKNIIDDELGEWLAKLADRLRPAPGAAVTGNITVTLDTCYSGSATRGALIARGRSWNAALDGPLPVLRPELPPEFGAGILNPRTGTATDYVVVAAARADQTAWERNGQGLFTRHWVRFLGQADANRLPTYQAAVDSLAIELAAEGIDQLPQVEGAVNQLLFSGHAPPIGPRLDALRAQRAADGALWLPVGEVQGVTMNSLYRLYKVGVGAPGPNSQLGDAVVVEATPFAARLQAQPGVPLFNLPGALAVEVQHTYALAPLRVVLVGFTGVPKLQAALAQLDIIRIVGTDRDSLGQDHDLELYYEQVQAAVTLVLPSGSSPVAPISLHHDELDPLMQKLRAEWRRRHFAGLRRETPEASVDLELLPADDDAKGTLQQAGSPRLLAAPLPATHLRLPREKWIGLRLHNRSSRALYVAVIAISPDGDLDLLFGSTPGDNRIAAGATLLPPLNTIRCQLTGQRGERVLIKVIATDTFVDFSGVERASQPPGTRHAGSQIKRSATMAPLQSLLEGLAEGTRSVPLLLQPAHWGTTDASVTIE